MIQTLRRRFILTAMLSLMGTLFLIGIAINLGNLFRIIRLADTAIELLYRNGGAFPLPDAVVPNVAGGFQITEETPFETRYCIVYLTKKREVIEVDIEHIAALDRDRVEELVGDIVKEGKKSGFVGYYRYRVYEEADKNTIVVLNCFLQLQSAHNVLQVTLLVFLCCVAIVFFLLLLFSSRVMRPFAENMERQKRFITDVSHELKTPLGIISANMGVLEIVNGKDEWIESTQNQVRRLDSLIRDLIELAKSEEMGKAGELRVFNVSETARNAADTFRTSAQAQGKQLETAIEPELYMKGQQEAILRLLTVLLDNAVKYGAQGSDILVRMSAYELYACIEVCSEGNRIPEAERNMVFQRFYRGKQAAMLQEGVGLGLFLTRKIISDQGGYVSIDNYGENGNSFRIFVRRSGDRPGTEEEGGIARSVDAAGAL